MIWTVLIITISCIAGIVIVLCTLVIFPTIYIGAAFSYSGNKKSISLKSWWLHPWVATATIDPFSHRMVITLCGYTLKERSGKNAVVEPPADLQEEKIKQNVSSVKGTSGDGEHFNKKSPGLANIDTEKQMERVRESSLDEKSSDDMIVFTEIEYFEKKREVEVPVEPPQDHSPTDRIKEPHIENETPGTHKSGQSENRAGKKSLFKRFKSNRYLFIARNRTWQRKTVRWLIRFIKHLFKVVVFDRFILTLKAGIEDPSLLGKVFGFYEMVRYSVKVGRGYHLLKFEPVFMRYHFEGEGSFGVRTSVARVIFPLFVALVTAPYFTTLLLFWKSRKLKRI